MTRHERDRRIVRAILRFGKQIQTGADPLIRRNPNAFLIRVMYDQSIPTERVALVIPTLRRRLGHLNLRRIARMSLSRLQAVVRRRPAIHRYPNTMARLMHALVRKIVFEYHGRGAMLWRTARSMEEIKKRLHDLPGYGIKKVEMCARMLMEAGIQRRDGRAVNVAVDVHVRRVFARAGLVQSGKVGDILKRARELHPSFPGEMDLALWQIGHDFCHARKPDCDGEKHAEKKKCPLSGSCPCRNA